MAKACYMVRATAKQQVLDGVNKLTLQMNKHGQNLHDAILLYVWPQFTIGSLEIKIFASLLLRLLMGGSKKIRSPTCGMVWWSLLAEINGVMLVVPLLNSSICYFSFTLSRTKHKWIHLIIVCDVIFSLMRIIFKSSIYICKKQLCSASCCWFSKTYTDIRNMVRVPEQIFNFFSKLMNSFTNEFMKRWIHRFL